MSFSLANILRDLRGKRTQLEMALWLGVCKRTYCRLEQGHSAKWSTIEQILDVAKTDRATRAAVMRAWVELEVGENNLALMDKPGESVTLRQITGAAGKFQAKDQEEILKALRNPKIVSCLRNLNSLAAL